VDPDFICHHLNVNPFVVPKKQSPRHSSKEHSDAVKQEVLKLKRAWAIKEVFCPEWLANTLVVKKKSKKWRVCVDFIDLNKACPKDPFFLPQGSFPFALDRSTGGCNRGPSLDELLGCFLGISPDTIGSG